MLLLCLLLMYEKPNMLRCMVQEKAYFHDKVQNSIRPWEQINPNKRSCLALLHKLWLMVIQNFGGKGCKSCFEP